MSSTERRKFSAQYKAEAVQMVVQSGRPIAHVAKDLDIVEQTLARWVKAWRDENEDREDQPLAPAQLAELKEAQAEIAKLRMENEFLKKCAAFFAKTQP